MINTEVNPTLADQLRELRLPAFRDNYEPLARQAEQETLSYEQYLQELAIRECETRRVNRIDASSVEAAIGEDAGELRHEAAWHEAESPVA